MLPRSSLLIGALGAAALAGCATAPPSNYAVNNTRTYPTSKDAMFERLLTVSTRNSMLVTSSDKRSGVLSFERSVLAPSRSGAVYDWADCGLVSLAERPISQLAEVNMVVEDAGAGSKVTINSRFSETRQDMSHRSRRLECTTTGALEQQLLESFAR
jgi:hypothetical protein